MKSVSDASAKTIAASTSPPFVLPSNAATSTGTSMILSTVRTLGRFKGNTPAQNNPAIERNAHEHPHSRTRRTAGLRARSRLHGDVSVLRHRRRGRGARDDRAGAGARLQLPRHVRHVRAAHE